MAGTQIQIVNVGVWPKGAEITLAWDFNNFCATDKKSTTVSSATVTTDDSAISIGTSVTASNVVTVTLTAAQEGRAMVKTLAVLADGDSWPVYWKMEVIDPKVEVESWGTTDYQT